MKELIRPMKDINVSALEFAILRDYGKEIDVQVTYKVLPGNVIEIRMRRQRFYDYDQAREYLKHIVDTELRPVARLNLVVVR